MQDMYRVSKTRVKTTWGTINSFVVRVTVPQGFTLSLYLFVVLMDDLLIEAGK